MHAYRCSSDDTHIHLYIFMYISNVLHIIEGILPMHLCRDHHPNVLDGCGVNEGSTLFVFVRFSVFLRVICLSERRLCIVRLVVVFLCFSLLGYGPCRVLDGFLGWILQ